MKISINGYGSIGKRIVDAVNLHNKLELIGVSKYTQDEYDELLGILDRDDKINKKEIKNPTPVAPTS